MRWRICLAEYSSEIHYKKGLLNAEVDALPKLSSRSNTTEHEDIDEPCFASVYSNGANENEH